MKLRCLAVDMKLPEQFSLTPPAVFHLSPEANALTLSVRETPSYIDISSDLFTLSFSTARVEWITCQPRESADSCGIEPNFWRGLTDNDLGAKLFDKSAIWQDAGKLRELSCLTIEQPSSHTAVVTTEFTSRQSTADIYPDLDHTRDG